MKENLLNAFVFNFLWLLTVATQPHPNVLIGLLAALYFCHYQTHWRVILCLVGYGIAQDTLLTRLNAWQFSDPTFGLPLWLALLWWIFATWLATQSHWLAKQPPYLVVIGMALLAPLSYLAAEKLGAVQFLWSPLTLYLTLAPLWGLFTLFYLTLLRRLPAK